MNISQTNPKKGIVFHAVLSDGRMHSIGFANDIDSRKALEKARYAFEAQERRLRAGSGMVNQIGK